MFNPYALSFHEWLYRTYGNVARVYGFLGVCQASEGFSLRGLTTNVIQDIQLVVSDPKACNNIFIKDQVIFEETDAILRCVFSFPRKTWCCSLTQEARTCRHLVRRSFLRLVCELFPKSPIH